MLPPKSTKNWGGGMKYTVFRTADIRQHRTAGNKLDDPYFGPSKSEFPGCGAERGTQEEPSRLPKLERWS